MLEIKFEKCHPNAKIPTKATENSNGYDLYAVEDKVIDSSGHRHDRIKSGIGLKVEIPKGFAMLICPRSGKADKNGVTITNSPGLIDSDYRGEIGVLMINHGSEPFKFNAGDKIAQAIFVKTEEVVFEEGKLNETGRGEGGFGHSDAYDKVL